MVMAEAGGIRILALSDVAVGYGSPQVQYLLDSLRRHYGGGVTLMMAEPDQKRRALREPLFPDINVTRVVTTLPPYHQAFWVEYTIELRKLIEEFQPHILIATHGWVLPAVLTASWRAPCFIYYMLESLSHQTAGIGEMALEINRLALEAADLVLVPERRRAVADFRAAGWPAIDLVEILNVSMLPPEETWTPVQSRQSALLYAGSIGPQTMSEYLGDEALQRIRIDIAGPADTDEARALLADLAARRNVNYLGVLPASELQAIRGQYAYSLVMWRPTDINQLYASPNKFFETIQVGVPPICAPHPQCADILARYECGRVYMDWSASQFTSAVQGAMRDFDTGHQDYANMVAACAVAVRDELNWDSQFQKVARRLPDAIEL